MELLVAIDDTDSLDSDHGTGRVSRELGAQLAADYDLDFHGSVRQQFLVDPRVPYTTHNSAACLIFEADSPLIDAVIDDAGSFLAEIMADVADPGLCVAPTDAVPEDVAAFGRRDGYRRDAPGGWDRRRTNRRRGGPRRRHRVHPRLDPA